MERNLQYAMDDSAMKIAKLESLLHSQRQEADAKQVSWIQKIEELKWHNQRIEKSLQQHEERVKGRQEDGDRETQTIKELNKQGQAKEQTLYQLKSHTKELKKFYDSGDLTYKIEEIIAVNNNLKEDKKTLTLEISKLESRQRTLDDSLSLSQKNEEYSKKTLKRALGEIASIEKALEKLNEVLRENQ
ncbi:unnamed protein product [Rhizopus stolonifer]